MDKKKETKLRELKIEQTKHLAGFFREAADAHPDDLLELEQMIPAVPDESHAAGLPAPTPESSDSFAKVPAVVPRGGLFGILNKLFG